MSPQRFAVYLDRDGTIVDDPGYLADPDALRLLDGAAEGVRLLHEAGALLVLVSNQSGIARGYMTRETVDTIHAKLLGQLRAAGGDLDAIYLCPHLPAALADSPCDCRKPEPGMILRARRELGLDEMRSFVVGDKAADMGLARRVDATAVLVRSRETREEDARGADHVAMDLEAAAHWILMQIDAAP
jgi:histidinol-phosphate phosphatase family protein